MKPRTWQALPPSENVSPMSREAVSEPGGGERRSDRFGNSSPVSGFSFFVESESTMNVTHHESPGKLVQVAGEFLERNEAENGLILGVCSNFARKSEIDCSQTWFLTIEQDGSPIGAALMTPPRNLVITRLPDSAIDPLIRCLLASDSELSRLSGFEHFAPAFAHR